LLEKTLVPFAARTAGRIVFGGSLAACIMTYTEGYSLADVRVQLSPTFPLASTASEGTR
jgi:hypothetical protein